VAKTKPSFLVNIFLEMTGQNKKDGKKFHHGKNNTKEHYKQDLIKQTVNLSIQNVEKSFFFQEKKQKNNNENKIIINNVNCF